MSAQEPNEPLEQARDGVWEALQMLEQAQRELFRAGDTYVARVWGDGVRSIIEATERLTDVSGDLMAVHIELGRLARRARANTDRSDGGGR
jgi:hypothetical protein